MNNSPTDDNKPQLVSEIHSPSDAPENYDFLLQ